MHILKIIALLLIVILYGVDLIKKIIIYGLDKKLTYSQILKNLKPSLFDLIKLKDKDNIYQHQKIVGYIRSEPEYKDEGIYFMAFIEKDKSLEKIVTGDTFEFRNKTYKLTRMPGFSSSKIGNVKLFYCVNLIAKKID